MPTGGVYSAGVGLQLQSSTPGIQDKGNVNISGTVLAGVFSVNPSFGTEKFGKNISIDPGTTNTTYLGYGISDLGNRNDNGIGIGYAVQIGRGSANVAIGSQAKAGDDIFGIGGNIAIGFGTRAGTNGLGSALVIGNSVLGETAGRCIILTADANGYNFNGIDNSIIMGNNIGTRAHANSTISIGTNQSNVYVGVYRIGQSTGGTVKVADTNYVMASTDGIVGWSSITAPRTNTLPPAASVPAGYIVRVGDFSGSATGVNSITTGPSGTDTIVGPGTPTVTTGYGWDRYMSDGVSKWICNNNL